MVIIICLFILYIFILNSLIIKKIYRIASYNVCYTKLLRVIFTSVLFVFLPEIANGNSVLSIIFNILLAIVSGLSLVVLCNIISKATIIPNKKDVVITIIIAFLYWFANSSLVVLASIFRITSYNVCYTKLLRNII